MLTVMLYYKQNLKYAKNVLNEELVHASRVNNLYWFYVSKIDGTRKGHFYTPLFFKYWSKVTFYAVFPLQDDIKSYR